MTTYYINSQGSNGTGSLINPYNSFTELNARTGDLGGDIYLLKSGTTIQDYIKPAAGVSNFKIGYYGSGAQPVIDGCRTKTGAWSVYSGTVYQIAHTHGFDCVFVDGVRLNRATSLAAITLNQCWWASNVLYVDLGGLNPASYLIETALDSASATSVIYLGGASSIEIDGIHTYRGNVNGVMMDTTGNSVYIHDCIATYNGNYGSTGGRDGFDIWGSKVTPSTGIVLVNNQADYNVNCAIELWGLDGLSLESNTGLRNGNGIELWGYITNAGIKYNTMRLADTANTAGGGRSCGLWATGSAQGTDTGHNYGNTIESNVFDWNIIKQIEIQSGGTAAGQTPWKINNNTFLSGTNQADNTGLSSVVIAKNGSDATDDITIQFNNNIIIKDCGVGTTSRNRLITFGATGLAANHAITGDRNHFLIRNAGVYTGKYYFLGTAYNTLALYKAAIATAGYTFEVNSTDGEPLFTSESTYDYSLTALSPALSTGDPTWSAGTPRPKSFNGELRPFVTPDIGAYQTASVFSASVITQAPGGGY